jgi:iron complex outermembrane receptor protein
LYFDHTKRESPAMRNPFNYELSTYDMDIRYDFLLGKSQAFLVGASYRYMQDETNNTSFNPQNRTMPLASAFIQDEIALIHDKLKLTVGSKFFHNVFTGYEFHPSARIAYTPNTKHTLWTAASRSVRIPSRFDSDLVTPTGESYTPVGFVSEYVNAYELGYRVKAMDNLFFSLATHYNFYTHLRSLNIYSSTVTPTILANDQRAESWGIELSGTYKATKWWTLRAGYNYFEKKISATSPNVHPLSANFEGVDPKHQAIIQSIMDLPKSFSIDVVGRYVDALRATAPIPSTPSYFSLDVRIAKQFDHLEISLVGQHLLQEEHLETGIYPITRSIYGRVICRF